MKVLHFIAKGAVLLILSWQAIAETVVIVHPSNSAQIDAKQVQRIFLGKEKKFSDGAESIPVNQIADSSVRSDFDTTVLGRSSSQVSAYWSKLVFTGKGVPPKEVTNDAEVLALVAKNPSAIGYVDAASVDSSVKVVPLD
ncbi:phosphate ABC transporter substrate-binding protein [Alteromonas sp. ASW11-36]|uniref:Phosphate ABC transporter substrate-binding protein n=1 Tax=Alteromonas arenosi TaxID=3055817 RepID=A0ABT7SY69_9ALTE|nr:phosphate ABC transporter substrate-binding protein [Alteromonas sp. ASW11-36]MDM7860477.1 phosphate ABC transporter substrate-binding protein [Alteromonas sp. ASW11-36]